MGIVKKSETFTLDNMWAPIYGQVQTLGYIEPSYVRNVLLPALAHFGL